MDVVSKAQDGVGLSLLQLPVGLSLLQRPGAHGTDEYRWRDSHMPDKGITQLGQNSQTSDAYLVPGY